MKKIFTSTALLAFCANAFPQMSFNGNALPVITEPAPAATGLDAIYVVNDVAGVSASYHSMTGNRVKWYRFSNLGGGYAEELTNVSQSGDISTLQSVQGDMGYIIEDGNDRHFYWVVNYSAHRINLGSLSISPESDCSTAVLAFDGNADAIRYYTINGQMQELSRGLKLSYSTLKYDEGSDIYTFEDLSDELAHVSEMIRVNAPLCNTDFTLSGDKFLEAWEEAQSITSSYYEAKAVEAHTTAQQVERDNDNEQKGEVNGLGGSAPAEIEFHAVTTDAAIFKEWQIATDAEFDFIDYRSNEADMTYVFNREGVFYVRFMASNAAGDCEYFSSSYEVSIGDSDLICPNAFSPGSSEGINDIWKVSYKSITQFECHIFNRWGVQVAHFTDPSQGWDGKYRGKLVPAGVYYYVIKAYGADGKEYNLRGDINIINYRQNLTGTGNMTE